MSTKNSFKTVYSKKSFVTGISRRNFITTSGFALGAMALPSSMFGSSPNRNAATYVRANLTSPEGQKALNSYAKAINRMLELPPTNPRNWYRNAMIHILDCPHGNFWFLPWHRGYLGWFEQIIRDISEDATFALPYWDWTALQKVPASMFDGVLTPANTAYYSNFSSFIKDFETPINDFWNGLSDAQLNQLAQRAGGLTSAEKLKNYIKSNWFTRSQARGLTPSNPGFDKTTQKAVSIGTINSAIAATTFIDENNRPGFGSWVAKQHSGFSGFDILESQPHNNVHGNVGGFMSAFMSSLDPIFFMHHSNIDRLWDVWTRKQERNNDPTTPEGKVLEKWNEEPFLFYVDSNGKPVSQNQSKDYVQIGKFDYEYTAGSGETDKATPTLANFEKATFAAALTSDKDGTSTAGGNLELPKSLLDELNKGLELPMYVAVTIQVPSNTEGVHYHVVLNVDDDDAFVDFNSPNYVGSFEFFGKMAHHSGRDFTFHISLNDSLARLGEVQNVDAKALNIKVVADRDGIALKETIVNVKSIAIGTF